MWFKFNSESREVRVKRSHAHDRVHISLSSLKEIDLTKFVVSNEIQSLLYFINDESW